MISIVGNDVYQNFFLTDLIYLSVTLTATLFLTVHLPERTFF
jgi:hypothetical protein